VLVNATPAGAARDPKGAAVDLEWASPEAVVVESNYLPPRTPLTAEAAARGFAVVGGDEVYAAQAAAQLRLFLPAEGDLGESVRAATAWGLGCVASS
jgi:shikimate 5-dehydrogenase